MNYWLNIDVPTKNQFYTVKDVGLKLIKKATPLKGIGILRKDGGWLSFSSISEAKKYFEQKYPNKTMFTHSCVDLRSE